MKSAVCEVWSEMKKERDIKKQASELLTIMRAPNGYDIKKIYEALSEIFDLSDAIKAQTAWHKVTPLIEYTIRKSPEKEWDALREEYRMREIVRSAANDLEYRIEKMNGFSKTLPNFLRGPLKTTKEYGIYREKLIKEGRNLFIPGRIQAGKTKYAVELAREYILYTGRSAVFVPLNGAVAWDLPKFSEMMASLTAEKLFIIDDIIEDVYRLEEWTRTKPRALLKELFSRPVRLIITSNNKMEDIKDIWDEPHAPAGKISERIKRNCYIRYIEESDENAQKHGHKYAEWLREHGTIRPIDGYERER